MITGNTVIAKSLSAQKLHYCFGISGMPIIELGLAVQLEGINIYGFRNEQGASYAAGAIGYLT
jgi:2-hydroxyacyl-CoA lyase 1